jgi:tetratricopeptide (TPR) repeat protein
LLYNIACSYEKIGKHDNAVRWLGHLLEVSPAHADALYGLALNYFKTRNYADAVTAINRALDHH